MNQDIKSETIKNTFTDRDITLLYMHVYGTKSKYYYLEHFQYSRSPIVASIEVQQPNDLPSKRACLEKEYNSNLPGCLEIVKEHFCDKSYHAIITAPSCSNLHKDFFDTIKDVTNGEELFKFKKGIKAAETKDFCLYCRNFSMTEKLYTEKKELNSILIVDDVYAEGKTIGAIIKKLRCNNISVDEIFVFTPLRI